MRSSILFAALGTGAATLFACAGDDTIVALDSGAPRDAAAVDASSGDASAGDATNGVDAADAGNPVDASDAATSRWALLSYNSLGTSSELVALNLGTKKIDGRLIYPGTLGTTSTQSPDPYLLEQKADVVGKLDRTQPWVLKSTWSVKLDDKPDGGDAYTDPATVVVGAGASAIVLRYTRNTIAVLDTTQVADAGAPSATIDLSTLVQQGDGDGIVEMTSAVYVPSKHLAYVALGNIDRTKVSSDGYTLLCAGTASTIIGIDVDQKKLVTLPNGDAKGQWRLGGTNPIFGGLIYDAAGDRLLVVEAGCNQPGDGGAAGALVGRRVEEVPLATGTPKTLLEITGQFDFPGTLALIDAHHAIFQVGSTYVWDPTTTSLGAKIANAPDSWTYDGAGNLIGLTTNYGDGGVVTSIDVLSVRASDGQKTVLASNPFTLTGGFVGGIDLWPR